MIVVYAGQFAPETLSKSIFLAGPTPRSKRVASWRPEALKILEALGYDGVVFVPEDAEGKVKRDYADQIEWEEKYLNMADCILFWVPRKLNSMPAFTTNTEWGVWQNSGKVVFGAPKDAVKVNYQRYYARKLGVPSFDTLPEVVGAAVDFVGRGAQRTGGERDIPLYIWETLSFQEWYQAQRTAGNRLDGARVAWTFRVGPDKKRIFLWILHANVYVSSEKRNKTNEIVISRRNIASIVLYRRGKTPDDTDIVLVREFRSPASTKDGFVWEIPSGSSSDRKKGLFQLVIDECYEETGLKTDVARIKYHASRQLMATLSAHKAYVFSMELTEEELDFLRSQKGKPNGLLNDTERTYVEVVKLGDIRRESLVDWSVLGMILSVLG